MPVSEEEAKDHGTWSKVRRLGGYVQHLMEADEDTEHLYTASGFPKGTEQFPLCCNNLEFAELGAGFPMYFDFLKQLVLLLVGYFILMVPAMVVYGQENKLSHKEDGWKEESRLGDLLTAGNLGRNNEGTQLPTIAMACVAIFTLVILVHFNRRQEWMRRSVDKEACHPNDFAIMIRGLPPDAIDEEEISVFFEEHATPGDESVPVVKVVVGFDVAEHFALQERKKKIEIAIGKKAKQKTRQRGQDRSERTVAADTDAEGGGGAAGGCCSCLFGGEHLEMRDMSALRAELENVKAQIAQMSQLDSQNTLKGSGYAILILKKEADQRSCLDRWSNDLWVQLHRLTCGLIPTNLPKFRGNIDLRVERAPNPDDIVWHNMGFTDMQRLQAKLKTYGIVIFLLGASFGATYGLTIANKELVKAELGGSIVTFVLSMLLVGVIAGINVGLQSLISYLVPYQRHVTVTGRDASEMNMLTAALVLNTALIHFISNINPKEWYAAGGLMQNMLLQLCFNAVIVPFFYLLDLTSWFRRLLANRIVNKIGVEKTKMTQEQFNKYYEGPAFDTSRRYANILKTFTVTAVYLPVLPLGTVVSIFALIIMYWVDKFILLRWCVRPYVQSSFLADNANRIVRLVAIFIPVFALAFLGPSLGGDARRLNRTLCLMLLAAAVVLFVFPISWQRHLCLTYWCQRRVSSEVDAFSGESYYVAQYNWAVNTLYHTTNPIYKALGEELNPPILADPDADTEDISPVAHNNNQDQGGDRGHILKRKSSNIAFQSIGAARPSQQHGGKAIQGGQINLQSVIQQAASAAATTQTQGLNFRQMYVAQMPNRITNQAGRMSTAQPPVVNMGGPHTQVYGQPQQQFVPPQGGPFIHQQQPHNPAYVQQQQQQQQAPQPVYVQQPPQPAYVQQQQQPQYVQHQHQQQPYNPTQVYHQPLVYGAQQHQQVPIQQQQGFLTNQANMRR
ncbi:unnamed protein product [Vitrella brassicaformis CCMP3155]|uniref:CSC1/OSCA1-like cytosolic domain-containing protein n=1 Tax=Vitrella brassicaformis (strain CCMP3155) TaxID=1169540 RepID=A0A0G4GUA1_VITBC|nr:unnamed protein product [Vitrella brassicaformis CCMP3155]|eukprot:CEM34404.1 unnamed protein product [Vitrella brassicaformis CCMP3155]